MIDIKMAKTYLKTTHRGIFYQALQFLQKSTLSVTCCRNCNRGGLQTAVSTYRSQNGPFKVFLSFCDKRFMIDIRMAKTYLKTIPGGFLFRGPQPLYKVFGEFGL